MAEEFRVDSLAEAERKVEHQGLWEAVADTAVKNMELVDREAVGKEFSRFFGAVHIPTRGMTRHKRKNTESE
jgi:hypothetical protein